MSNKQKTRKLTRVLRCKLTKDETIVAANEMADAQSTIGQLEDELNKAKSEYKGKIAGQEAIRSTKSQIISTGFEHRGVECTETMDWENGRVVVQRDDTGEIVDDRAMSESEKQMGLDLEETEEQDEAGEGEGEGGEDAA